MLRMLSSSVAAALLLLLPSFVLAEPTSGILNARSIPKLDRTLVEINSFFEKPANETASKSSQTTTVTSDFVFGKAATLPTINVGRYGAIDKDLGKYLMTEWKLVKQFPTSTDGTTTGASLQRLDQSMTACAFVADFTSATASAATASIIADQVASQCKRSDLVMFVFVSALPNNVVSALKLQKLQDLNEIAPNPALVKTSQHSSQVLVRMPSTMCMESVYPTSSSLLFSKVCRGKDCICSAKPAPTTSTSHSSTSTAGFLVVVVVLLVIVGVVSIYSRYRRNQHANNTTNNPEKNDGMSTPFLLVQD